MVGNKTLTVCKASAGSGKTFTLAVEYIKLLLENPYAYEGILAVTFTNKATEEMKMRILSTLYGLGAGLGDARRYMEALQKATGLAEDEIARLSGKVLRLLLHNYHFFRVQTIDTFFQSVLRNLAKELQLNANLRVALNNEQVVDQAVDNIIDTVADDARLKRIVVDYMNENIADDKKMDVIGDIKEFGGNIFKEHFKQNRQALEMCFANEKFFDDYKKAMYDVIRKAEKLYGDYSQEAQQVLSAHGLMYEDFSRGASGVMGYFLKLAGGRFAAVDIANKTVQAAIADAEKWVAKKHPRRETVLGVVKAELLPLMQRIEKTREHDATMVRSVRKTLQHLNDMRLLRRIEEMAHTLNEASQRFMLSDTQSLLSDFIADDDSPFIFEKIGSRLEHVMIDEFQDTSTVQWRNFKTLLRECMSQGNSNLIVGDVKQSIYRFRSGDWKLLNGIDREFGKDELDFQPKRTNYRSTRSVIEFNNAFFEQVAAVEVESVRLFSEERADELQKAYADVKQEVPEGRCREGYVEMELLPKSGLDKMNERVLSIIEELLDKGVEQHDIAILVRTGKVIPALAQCVEAGGRVRIVSDEAFRLDASKVLQSIISGMRLLVHPNDTLTKELLQRLCGGEIPTEFTERRNELLSMTLYDMAEALLKVLFPDEKKAQTDAEGAYLTMFFDKLQAFCNETVPVVEDFLELWDGELCRETIETAESNGVRVLTIHKSKGLEFRHVIVPYCNWQFNPPRPTLIWVKPKAEPFSQMPIVPLECMSATTLKGTIYEEDGYEEQVQKIVDNLNLLYVALTRAGETLHVIGERNAKEGNRSKAIMDAIARLPEKVDGLPVVIEGQESEEESLRLTYGDMYFLTARQQSVAASQQDAAEDRKAGQENVFAVTPKPVSVSVRSMDNRVEYRQSNDSRRFAEDAIDETDRQRMVRMGMVMHQLFASVRTLSDVEPMITRMEYDGTLYDEDMTREQLLEKLRSVFDNPQVKEWFSDRWRVFNECTIINKEGEHRPDRVITDGSETIVIDFKFGSEHTGYVEQVKSYMLLLREMGMPGVKGYLWYVTKEKIVHVED